MDISNFDCDTLCSIIASNRYIKFDNDLEKRCMMELANRRINGDDFNFESKIDELSKSFTDISISIPDIKNILDKIRKI